MKPDEKEIIEKLNVLTGWCMNSGEELNSTGKRALSLCLATTVELIRRRYDLTSAYYSTAEYAARVQYMAEYESEE